MHSLSSLSRFIAFGSAMVASSLVAPAVSSAEVSEQEFSKAMDSFLSKDENIGKVGDALERYFVKKRDDQQKKAQADEAKSLDEQLKNPVKVDVGKSPVRGPENAKITIVAFSDFQCPFCKRGADVLDDLQKKHPNDVKIAFKNLPLPFHAEAKGAAKAALAAGNQGKFWEMHDRLFNAQDGLNEANYVKIAGELGLNGDRFKTDMGSAEIAKQIDEDMKLAQSLGVQGTPGFFVNGVQVRGARPVEYFEQIISKIKK
ncbi:MAG: DsbA family protein [Deltaproteobacteria bacterium]|nr:DsbA family protein [Deltaproteobacteria bacterium]